jgi:uncharacterized membrane protein
VSGDASIGDRLQRLIGAVRLRQLVDRVRHRLSFIPMLYVVAAIVSVQLLLLVDRSLNDQQLPTWLETTVDSARSVFSAMAGGLITSITLLLSMMLVAVQLASSQFSPRTLRDWLGNRTLQHAIGIVLGTTVFCLLALRSTRDFADDNSPIVPHVTVLVAVALGVISLVAVVRAVDHLTHSVRVGSVAERVAAETIGVLERSDSIPAGQTPELLPSSEPTHLGDRLEIPVGAAPLETARSGWIQQIDEQAILDALPDDSTGYVAVSIGGFVPANAPLIWIDGTSELEESTTTRLRDSFAVGDGRTLQQDVEFGLVQLTDIAVRALSPGVNDPTTASDILVHIGNVMLAIWERDIPPTRRDDGGRSVVVVRPSHAAYLERSIGPIRRYGAQDPEVMTSIVHTLGLVRSEVVRRQLPGPVGPLDEAIGSTARNADTERWSAGDIERFRASVTAAQTRLSE